MNMAMSTAMSTATSLIKTMKTPTTQPPHPKRSKAVTPVVSIDCTQRACGRDRHPARMALSPHRQGQAPVLAGARRDRHLPGCRLPRQRRRRAVRSLQQVDAGKQPQSDRRGQAEPRAPGVPGGYELDAATEPVQTADPYPHAQGTRHRVPHVAPPSLAALLAQWAAMRVRAVIIAPSATGWTTTAILTWIRPSLTPAAEGTTTLFEIDYHGEPAYLAQTGNSTTRPTSSPSARSTASGRPSAPRRARPAATCRNSGWWSRRWLSAIWSS